MLEVWNRLDFPRNKGRRDESTGAKESFAFLQLHSRDCLTIAIEKNKTNGFPAAPVLVPRSIPREGEKHPRLPRV